MFNWPPPELPLSVSMAYQSSREKGRPGWDRSNDTPGKDLKREEAAKVYQLYRQLAYLNRVGG
jgi:hypothetical protein